MIVFGTAEYQLPMVAFLVGTLGLLAMLLGWVHVPLSGLAAIVLAVMSSHFLCLFPRKVIDISWSDLSAALYYALVPLNTQSREQLQAAIATQWSSQQDALVCLSVRSAMDLLLSALELPEDSEVLFVPGISIPAMIQVVESHGLRARGVDPPSAADLLVSDLEPHLSADTRVVVFTHLFGAIMPFSTLMQQAKDRGLFIVEDCAQAFLGAQDHGSSSCQWSQGFRGHKESHAAFVSFGLMKTLTALGGAVSVIRDDDARERMCRLQATYPVRKTSQFLSVVLKAIVIKLVGNAFMWGLVAALCGAVGIDFDKQIVNSVRGFPGQTSIRQQSSIPLLRLLLRRIQNQQVATYGSDAGRHASSTVACRRLASNLIKQRLASSGIEVVSGGSPANSWWLLPMVEDNPQHIVQALWSRGFDATCSSTQLKAVSSMVKQGPPKEHPDFAQELMSQVVYLPSTHQLPDRVAKAMARATIEEKAKFHGNVPDVGELQMPAFRHRERMGLFCLGLSLLLLWTPSALLWMLPSTKSLCLAALVSTATMAALRLLAQRLAAVPQMRIDSELTSAFGDKPRSSGVSILKSRSQGQVPHHVDGAILLTGATGFVGSGILLALLAQADEFKITRIVLLIRSKDGSSVTSRLAEMRASAIFDEVREVFDRLVIAQEGDVAESGFGWNNSNMSWMCEEPLRDVIHCAGDVRFDQPLQQAAVSLISATLQVCQLATRWKARKFIFVSTAFVHAVPSAGHPLKENLVQLRDFDPMELYRDAISDGRWAEKVMRNLGFPNTYTFSKAIAEHLVCRACANDALEVGIVRPSIVGPAWASPFPGWCGKKPSTIVAGALLLAKRGVRVFCFSAHPCPVVPVDMVAGAVIDALVLSWGSPTARITHATLDESEAHKVMSFKVLSERLLQVLAMRGEMSLVEAGLLLRLLAWAERQSVFWVLHTALNMLPSLLAAAASKVGLRAANTTGAGSATWASLCRATRSQVKYSGLPEQYLAFTSPVTPWLFRSRLRLPENWDTMEYLILIIKAALAFAHGAPPVEPSASKCRDSLSFQELPLASPKSIWHDLLLTFGAPGAPLHMCCAAFLVRRVLGWMRLSVTVDAASLKSVESVSDPLVLCPTHRSVLDFVIIGLVCFHLRPFFPVMQVPHVAADAEFQALPLLGPILTALGAFFVRRGGGTVQPDPALRAEVGRVFRQGRPLEVFLEGLRSRGRRQLRLRTGLLRALRDVSEQTVALLPVALSYELVPEDHAFFNELAGRPRQPLQTTVLITWLWRGLCGSLPPHGDAYVKLGARQEMSASTDMVNSLTKVQEQLVVSTSLTTLHSRALAKVLDLPSETVLKELLADGLPIRPSGVCESVQLSTAQLWALALQATVLLRSRLPTRWARWLVEPVYDKTSPHSYIATTPNGTCPGNSAPTPSKKTDTGIVVQMLTDMFESAESTAQHAVHMLQESGITRCSEEHLLQELVNPRVGSTGLPPPLARGAAFIVATRLNIAKHDQQKESSSTLKSSREVELLWPSKDNTDKSKNNEEALDRWGFKDTRFIAQWVDGRPAVRVTSRRYGKIGSQPMYQLWALFQTELQVSMNVRDIIPIKRIQDLSPPPKVLVEALMQAVPEERVHIDSQARIRAGTGHGLADIWKLRSGMLPRMPDVVVRPESEEEVLAVLCAAKGKTPFAVIPVGGRTNVTSATSCPSFNDDQRPFVALDMRGLSKVLWVNEQDGVAHIEAGITGSALKEALQNRQVTMGMEPDSMEFSTLGGWIATYASGMKRARYGNIEDMLVEVRVVTPSGVLWQHHGSLDCPKTGPTTAFGRTSTNIALPGLLTGSEGCVGVITSAIVRVHPLPEAVHYESVIFQSWDAGAAWMREVAQLPAALRPASCRLLDSAQLRLARALREEGHCGRMRSALQATVLRARGVDLEDASAVTLVFEGSQDEVIMQKRLLSRLVKKFAGIWGGSSSGEAGYALTFAIAYLRDFGIDYQILSESLETLAPWSAIHQVWPAVVCAVQSEHSRLALPGRPFMSCRMTQLYHEGAVLYMYLAVSTAGLAPDRALEAFHQLEGTARRAILDCGGCLSHHHGIGKLRAGLLPSTQAPALANVMHDFKKALDPSNILGARNGIWASTTKPPKTQESSGGI